MPNIIAQLESARTSSAVHPGNAGFKCHSSSRTHFMFQSPVPALATTGAGRAQRRRGGYRNVGCNATFQSAHAPVLESSAMSDDYDEYAKGMQQAEPPLTDAALSELRKLIDDWLTKTSGEHMPFFLFGRRPDRGGCGGQDRYFGSISVLLAATAPRVFAGHSGGPTEVSAVVGGARPCHGER